MWNSAPSALFPEHTGSRNKSTALGRTPNVTNFKIEPRNESLKLSSKEFLM
jgi:hypothetical protein